MSIEIKDLSNMWPALRAPQGEGKGASGANRQRQDENTGNSLQEAIDPRTLSEAVDKVNQHFQATQRNLAFSVDDATGRTVIRVTDSSSGEVIRQIPSEELLQFARYVAEHDEPDGMILKAEA